jgi:hypothetical protein
MLHHRQPLLAVLLLLLGLSFCQQTENQTWKRQLQQAQQHWTCRRILPALLLQQRLSVHCGLLLHRLPGPALLPCAVPLLGASHHAHVRQTRGPADGAYMQRCSK